MQASLQIAFHGMDGSEAVRSLIEEKVAWLERFYDRIIGCRVVLEAPPRHRKQGSPHQVRIDLTVPGGEIVVNREPAPHSQSGDLNVAIRDAFDSARRKLEQHVQRMRRDVKSHEAPPHAQVSRLFSNEGYGFLVTPDGREVYFHSNAVLNGGFGELKVADEVAFVEEAGDKGPQASTVRAIGRHNHE